MNYNTCSIAGLWEHPDAWGEPKLRWIPCEWPVLGVRPSDSHRAFGEVFLEKHQKPN